MKKSKNNYSLKILLIVGGACVLLFVMGLVVYRQLNMKKPEVMVVSFGDSENQVEVNRNGEVTIRTPFGVYKQKWDKKKIDEFFAKYNDLDFESLTEYLGEGLAIELTFGNGIMIKYEYEEDMSNLVEELQEELENVYKEDEAVIFKKNEEDYYYERNQESGTRDDDIDDDQNSNSGGSSTTNGDSKIDPWSKSGSQNLPKLECAEIDPKTGKSIIISNTVCGR